MPEEHDRCEKFVGRTGHDEGPLRLPQLPTMEQEQLARTRPATLTHPATVRPTEDLPCPGPPAGAFHSSDLQCTSSHVTLVTAQRPQDMREFRKEPSAA
jgi:hypothetical protein